MSSGGGGDGGGGGRSRSNRMTLDELQILRDLRVNAVVNRGFPLGILGAALVTIANRFGYFKKHSGPLMVGMISLGFFTGVASYKGQFEEDMKDLRERRKDRMEELKAERERALDDSPQLDDSSENEPSEIYTTVVDEEERPSEAGKSWDDIRKEARNAEQVGKTFDDVRLSSRANLGNYGSLTPEEEDDLERKLKIGQFSQPLSTDDQFSEKRTSKTKYGDHMS